MTTRKIKTITLVFILAFAAVTFLQAKESQWDVSIAFIGPADPLYSWWGHVAIIIEDKNTGDARYYDYGNFSFDEDSFINNFTMGRLYFLKKVTRPDPQLRYSAFLNRDVTLYKLNIPEDRKIEMIRFLENDVKPANCIYLYDHFYDNCSTRIRDILNTASGGELAKAAASYSGKTLRQQLRRFTRGSRFMDWLLNFSMKGNVDKPATVWESMFLPKELEAGISTLMVKDENGQEIPFVEGKKIYNQAKGRPEIPDMPPARWPLGFIVGAILAALGGLMLSKAADRTAVRRLFGLFSSLISLPLGLAGSLLLFMACFTDHNFTYWNMNLLFINPVMLVTLVFSLRLLFSRRATLKSVNRCWMITAAGAVLAIILKIIPFCRQDNWTSILLVLLPAMVFSGLLVRIGSLAFPDKHRTL
ncbi:MAG: DUF4105 domain-containing protein [Spirochaetales bacterium]|nr:DUF4105 domain-containing protein [Spirochaetales bacterium]